jgi:hypothetical protein
MKADTRLDFQEWSIPRISGLISAFIFFEEFYPAENRLKSVDLSK